MKSTAVLTFEGVYLKERKNKVLRLTAVRTGGGVDSRKRTKC